MHFSGLADRDLLELWEVGAQLHALDRSLLLYSWSHPEQPPDRVPDLPLGTIQASLLKLRTAWFGEWMELLQPCPACGSQQEIQLNSTTLLEELSEHSQLSSVQVFEHVYRLPSTRDLAAVMNQVDPQLATQELLERCLLKEETEGLGFDSARNPSSYQDYLNAVEAALEAADPAADIVLILKCSDCAHEWSGSLDAAEILWANITAQARALLLQVHQLALAYGWKEEQILALSPWRRSAYLNLVLS